MAQINVSCWQNLIILRVNIYNYFTVCYRVFTVYLCYSEGIVIVKVLLQCRHCYSVGIGIV